MRSSIIIACLALLAGPAAFATPSTQPINIPPNVATIDRSHSPSNITHMTIDPKWDVQANIQDSDVSISVGKAIRTITGQSNPLPTQPGQFPPRPGTLHRSSRWQSQPARPIHGSAGPFNRICLPT